MAKLAGALPAGTASSGVGRFAMLSVLNLGYGVQSSTIALMATEGEIEAPDCAIFADTHAEPVAVYEWIEWLTPRLSFPVIFVSGGDLRQELLDAARGERGAYGRPPVYLRNRDGSAGAVRRQCTGDYKIDPIQSELRVLLGLKPRQRAPKQPAVEQWIGISTDEIQRAKLSSKDWISVRWPLLEARMSRDDCLAWMDKRGYPVPPKSSCTFCPFRSDREWASLAPVDFDDACGVDRAIRDGMNGIHAKQLFLHRSLQPLEAVDLRSMEDLGQLSWLDECAGACGL